MAEVNSPKIEFDKKGSTSRFNLDVNQYADNFYDLKIVGSGGTAYNLTGYGFSGTIRKHVGSSITATDNISSGDYFQVTNISSTGFSVHFKDSSNASINRNFNFSAVGFGKGV